MDRCIFTGTDEPRWLRLPPTPATQGPHSPFPLRASHNLAGGVGRQNMPERTESRRIPPVLERSGTVQGNSKGHLREEHHLINNTASIRYYTQKAKQYPKISVHREVRITHTLTGGRVAHGLPALHFMGRESDKPLLHFSGGTCHVLIPNRTGAASGVAQK